ncbi:hypothetical protein JDV02_007215 [Purpureocillium takamizusanense]|uniref:Enoyl reductase (ER) domain-containing protein n=1 Tax=Purpureocillium takamizusanense TaxID=2060973 RepID=A0A9Q8QK84_9HYPO|nr:uncharacterized protein JDV02_007215 [Purpureocillium takamizusanense]UNI21205.1 hypothetical protein JDV02_007215 [Purpureocillium takamizusanense]
MCHVLFIPGSLSSMNLLRVPSTARLLSTTSAARRMTTMATATTPTKATTQKAVVIQGPGVAKLVTDRPIPRLRDDYILVKTAAVALNPTDWKHIQSRVRRAGPLVGCDYAGVVERVGPKVTKGFRPGDRICGMAHGSNAVEPEDGTFAERIVVKGDTQIEIPRGVSFEEAATLGVGITTVGQGLYQTLGMRLPSDDPPLKEEEEPVPVLIYGGSTATGTLGIQFAKLSGYTVLTTCSPRNAELVKAAGADFVFDYNEADVGRRIREHTNDKLRYAWDTISLPASARICAEALSSAPGGKYASLGAVEFPRDDCSSAFTLAYTALGEAFTFGDIEIPAKPQDYEFAKMFWELARELLTEGKIKAHPRRVRRGLEGVLDGLQELKDNKVSGEKLVYTL